MCSNIIIFLFTTFSIFSKFVNCKDFGDSSANSTLVMSMKDHYLILPDKSLFVNSEDIMHIFCTGPKSEFLRMHIARRLNDFEIHIPILTSVCNDTTIVGLYQRAETTSRNIHDVINCHDIDNTERLSISVETDPPKVLSQYCVTKDLITLDCKWSSTNSIADFKLYQHSDCDRIFLTHEENTVIFCISDIDAIYSPYWNIMKPFEIMARRYIQGFYKNTTIQINRLSVFKFDAPIIISYYYEKQSFYGIYHYRINFKIPTTIPGFVIHSYFSAVEVRYLVINTQQSQTLPRKTFAHVINNDDSEVMSIYEAVLELPCYPFRYGVMISVKTPQVMGERHWSDNSSVYVAPIENSRITDGEDDKCEIEIPVTPSMMLYELDEFKTNFIEKQTLLKNFIDMLDRYLFVPDVRK